MTNFEETYAAEPPDVSTNPDDILALTSTFPTQWVDLTEFNDLLEGKGLRPIQGFWIKALNAQQADRAMQNGRVSVDENGATVFDLSSMKPGASAELIAMAAIRGRQDTQRLFTQKSHFELLKALPRPVVEKAAAAIRELSGITSDAKDKAKKSSGTMESDFGMS